MADSQLLLAEKSEVGELDVVDLTKALAEYEIECPSSQRAIDKAEEFGWLIVFPADDELQLDIDNDESFQVFQDHRDILEKHFGGVLQVTERPSKSGIPGKRHVTVKLGRATSPGERVILQACLGSDRKREFLSYVQVVNGDPHPTLFWEKA